MKRKMTAARRAALRKAQLASARKRRKKTRSKDTLGYWLAKGVRKVASQATFGVSGMLTEFARKPAKKKKKRR